MDLVELFEDFGVLLILIFINGVEAYIIVRDMLTFEYE